MRLEFRRVLFPIYLIVMEKNPMSGGQVLTTYEVDNYLGLPGINGFDMGVKFKEHAEKLGIEFKEEEVIDVIDGEIKKVITHEHEYEARAIILTTGASHAHLEVPGEEELGGMGVSYCATCDGAFFRGKEVAVIGGGDVAIEDAIYLARFCKKVLLIHRREELRAAKILQNELFALANIEFLSSTIVKEIKGTDMVSSIIIEDTISSNEKEIPLDGVFIAVGIQPNTNWFTELVSCDEAGYVIAGEDGVTTRAGIFVAGDVRKKPLRQIITAVADGANAAVSAGSYINKF